MSYHILSDSQGSQVQGATDFVTTQATITNASYTEIELPAKCIQVMLRSAAAWSYSHDADEDGTTDFSVLANEVVILPVCKTATKSIYIKGAGAGQKLYICQFNSIKVAGS